MADNDTADWPVELRGVTEAVVTTLGPNDRWNLAALGLHAPVEPGADSQVSNTDGPTHVNAVTARTWGQTRTRRNFEERDGGYVQFTPDPVVFVEAALTVHEMDDPILDGTHAWVEVSVQRLDQGSKAGTEWIDWQLEPVEYSVETRDVFTYNRAYGAVVEATIAASRLEVDGYDADRLRTRIAYCETVVKRCGGADELEAFALLRNEIE